MRREDVEALRARVLRDADNAAGRGVKLADMTFSVEGDTLVALCRAWLALDGADSMQVLIGPRGFGEIICMPSLIGQRVRIVPTPNTTEGER